MANISSIFNFLKDYNELSNPVITEIGRQKWYYRLSNVPKIREVRSIYNVQEEFDGLKILESNKTYFEALSSPR